MIRFSVTAHKPGINALNFASIPITRNNIDANMFDIYFDVIEQRVLFF